MKHKTEAQRKHAIQSTPRTITSEITRRFLHGVKSIEKRIVPFSANETKYSMTAFAISILANASVATFVAKSKSYLLTISVDVVGN
jgi:hypothetical protein